MPEIDVLPSEAEQLTFAEPDEPGDEDQASQPRVDRISELVRLLDGGDGTLVGRLDTCALDVHGFTGMKLSSTAVAGIERRRR